MSVAFAAPRQRGKGEITPAAIQKVSRERRRDAGRGGVAWGRADAGFPTEPFGACSARTKALATAARFPRGPGGLAPRGREGSGPETPASPRRDPTRGSPTRECCAANSSELRPSSENLRTFRNVSGQARKEPGGLRGSPGSLPGSHPGSVPVCSR
uniref:Uncharacterized protein n=1 Tax=Mus musculus TaxID=10090 RepID=Q3U3G9_MOUSE|nr:unnamed protein product [Mus musculus]